MLGELEKSSNCESFKSNIPSSPTQSDSHHPRPTISAAVKVSQAEIQRLRKRFMKLDRDGSGSIDKEEFLQIPQIATNPLASRMIAIFDEEWVL